MVKSQSNLTRNQMSHETAVAKITNEKMNGHICRNVDPINRSSYSLVSTSAYCSDMNESRGDTGVN